MRVVSVILVRLGLRLSLVLLLVLGVLRWRWGRVCLIRLLSVSGVRMRLKVRRVFMVWMLLIGRVCRLTDRKSLSVNLNCRR